MKEKIKHLKSLVNGNNVYWVNDEQKGTPYATVTVQPDGDYFLSVYGSLCFERYIHTKIIKQVKPSGKNITVEKYYTDKRNRKV